MISREFRNPYDALLHLDERLEERKRLQPFQKFLDDQQIIKNRRENHECNPILPGHDQESWFSKLESNGIWEKVFDFVTNPSDMTSAYFSCEMFRKHLEEKRKMMMLPKVFEVLRRTGHLYYCGFKSGVSDANKEKSRDVLNLRLVSKSWKDIAETSLLVPRLHSERSSWSFKTESIPSGIPPDPMLCVFKHTDDVKKAIEALGTSTTCGALLRSIGVKEEYDDTDGTFHSKLLELLDTHGTSVWYFQFAFIQNKSINLTEFAYYNLWNTVTRMPNLKSLCLTFNGVSYWKMPETAENIDRIFREQAEKTPFPSIPTLEYFRFEWTNARYDFIIREVLSKNLQVKRVALNQYVYWEERRDISQDVWDAMINLQLEYFHIVSSWEPSDALIQLQRFDWPLKFLHIEYENPFNYDYNVDAFDMLSVFNHFNDSLEEVSVHSNFLKSLFGERSVVVHLPNFKSMDIPAFAMEKRLERVYGPYESDSDGDTYYGSSGSTISDSEYVENVGDGNISRGLVEHLVNFFNSI